MTRMDRPIFIVGTGRCGSTVLHRMMAEHSQVSFLTGVIDRYPAKLKWQRMIMRMWDWPVVGTALRRRLRPSEAWGFWGHYVPGLGNHFRDLRADDVTHTITDTLHNTLPQIVTAKRSRLLIKFTGWTQIGFIKEVFPDARIVHILREPHAVVNSLLHMEWWRGWQGPEQWRWGPLDEEERRIWRRYNESFLVLAAIQWKKLMEAYRKSLALLPEEIRADIHESHYCDLCNTKDPVVRKILSFCELEDERSFWESLSMYALEDQNYKWRRDLTDMQQQQLEEVLEELQWDRYGDWRNNPSPTALCGIDK